MKFMVMLVIENFVFVKLLVMSDNGMSRNSANSSNAKKIVMSDGLICLKKSTLFNNKPNIMAPNISMGSYFSIKSIRRPF